MKTLLWCSLVLTCSALTGIGVIWFDNNQFNRMISVTMRVEQENEQLTRKLKQTEQLCVALNAECYRQHRVASMVQVPVRTEIRQKPGTKFTYVTVPPNPDKFDLYESYIELTPKPHFAKRLISKARWDEIWKCTCPATCDCWIGKPCSSKGCQSKHN